MVGYGKRVLVVDDDERAREETALALEGAGFAVVRACEALGALAEMRRRRFDAVVVASPLPHLNGIPFLSHARVLWPDTPVLIISDARQAMIEAGEIGVKGGAFAWIRKSSDPQVLLSMVVLAVDQHTDGQSARVMEQVGI